MKRQHFAAFVAALITFLVGPSAIAAPVQPITSGGDFGVASVVEIPGTYPPVTYVYGGSSRAGLTYTEFGVLTSTDGFATNPTWQAMTGIVGYAGGQVNSAIVTCPAGKTCGGYKAFYVIDDGFSLYRCTGLSGVKDLSGCSLWSVAGITGYDSLGIGLDQTGDKVLIGAKKAGDTFVQIYSIDIATSTATKLSACSDALDHTVPNGSVAGEGGNRYLYVFYNLAHYRLPWDGTTCSGPRSKVDGSMGWDNAVDSGVDDDYYGAVGQLTGTFFLSRTDGSFFISKKNAVCNDSFISGAESCDPSNANPLNGQSCTTVPGGFTGGALACDSMTCNWNTSSCTLPPSCGDLSCNGGETCSSCPGDCGVCPPVCGNNIKEGSEICDGSDLNGNNCTTIPGGYTGGTLACNGGCSGWITSGCTVPPSCGDLSCNGAETCSSCPGDCGACPPVCGNGIKEGSEICDGADLGGNNCTTIGMGFSGGTLACNGGCSTWNTSACTLPPSCGDTVCNGAETCSSCPGDCGVCPPSCGDTVCNGSETCSTCPSDCGACCGNGVINGAEQCDGSAMGGATCDSVMGSGWTGAISCKLDCTYNTASCAPPPSCGNNVINVGEQCDGSEMGGATCSSELGDGWSGSVSCASCSVNTSDCTFDWGLKNLSGACTFGGSGMNQSINFSGGTCTAEYWPIGALMATKLKLVATAGKVLPVMVASAGGNTSVEVPQGVSHEEVNDNGNKYETTMGGVELGVEGTIYAAMWKSYPIALFTCTEGSIKLSFSSTPIAAINVDGTSGRLPAGYGVEVNTQTGEVTKAPYKLDGSGGDGGAGGDGGTGGSDSGAGGEGGSSNLGGSDTSDEGSCSAVPGRDRGSPYLIIIALAFAMAARRRRAS